jgi:hypothetical protein
LGLGLARGETVIQKLERLRGVAREAFIKKWITWITKMIPPGTDPAMIIGEPRITENTIIKLFREHCPDLEESECHDKLAEIIQRSKATRKTIFDPEFIRDFEKNATISAVISKILNLDWEVNPFIADSIYKAIFDERDVAKACELVRYDVVQRWTVWGEEPPIEELALADKACERIKELAAKRAPPIEWWKVLEPVYRTREEIAPSIKPYIMRIRAWGIHKDLEGLVKEAKPGDLRLLAGVGAIEKLGLTVRYMEDLKPIDLTIPERLKEVLEIETTLAIYPYLKVREAQEFIYVNKFYINGVEVPLLCVYLTKYDYIVACDRPAILAFYGEEETATAPIPLIKMVRELYKRGIVVEKVEV